jgi:uncharacterized DUF497 family protein
MEFLWDENNRAHLNAHGISPRLAESVFWTGLVDMRQTCVKHRYVIEAELAGTVYRLVCDISMSGTIYPVACFHL